MQKKILIIGKGSSAKNHKKALKMLNKNLLVESVSSRTLDSAFGKSYKKLTKLNPDYFIICSPSTYHYKHFKVIEKFFKKKIVLIEKPLFDKTVKIKKKPNNRYFVGYNLRLHPVLIFVKKYLKNKKIFSIRASCSSYLPDWRRQASYRKSVSGNKKLGGGVLLELSHELDYLTWIFGKIKLLNVFNKKVSNLKIDTDDILNLSATTSKKSLITLNINFFSKIVSRELIIDGNNFSLFGDLTKNKITLYEGNKKKVFSFKNFKLFQTYKLENYNMINKRFKNLCSLNEGLRLVNLLSQIRKKTRS